MIKMSYTSSLGNNAALEVTELEKPIYIVREPVRIRK